MRAHSLDKLKLFHHFAERSITDRNQIKMAFNTAQVYNDWKQDKCEVFADVSTLSDKFVDKNQFYKNKEDAKSLDPLLEKTESFIKYSQKRNYISSLSMADLIEIPVK